MHTSTDFVLHGGDEEFASRRKLLFDKLTIAERQCNKNKASSATEDTVMRIEEPAERQILRAGQKRKSETRKFRGRESIFKRPEGPAPRAAIRNIPDHRKNPHKWVKYSLDDVSNDDMTDKSNTQAALSFLKELKARRLREQAELEEVDVEMIEPDEEDQVKVVFKSKKGKTGSEIKFKRPETETEKVDTGPVVVDSDDKPVFRSSKVIMPEYVVGQKQKKKGKDKPKVRVDRTKELKLDHLQEFDEEED